MTLKEAQIEFKKIYPNGWIQRNINGASIGTVSVNFGNGRIFDYGDSMRRVLSKILKTEVL